MVMLRKTLYKDVIKRQVVEKGGIGAVVAVSHKNEKGQREVHDKE